MLLCGSESPETKDDARVVDNNDVGLFNMETAHAQLLDALRAIDCKLDGLAEAVRSSRSPSAPAPAAEPESPTGFVSEGFREVGNYRLQAALRTLKNVEASHQVKEEAACGPSVATRTSTGNSKVANTLTSSTYEVVGMSSQTVVHPSDPPGQANYDVAIPQGRRSSLGSASSIGELMWLEIRPGYDSIPSRRSSGHESSGRASITRWRNRHSVSSERIDIKQEVSRWNAWNPDSLSRTMFEVTSMVMLLYDAFIMPYRIAWDMPDYTSSLLIFVVWFVRIFWTVDLLLNLVTGYRDKEAKLQLTINMAMRHYVATWFLPDLILVTCDWLTVFYDGHRWIRWMRIMRLVRGGRQVIRGWTLILKAKLMIQTIGLHLVMDIALLLLIILWVNHMVCCMWFGIGKYYESDTGYTWLTELENVKGGSYYDYLTALHWAMTQMTPGSMEVFPKSSVERIYNVLVLLLGLLMGSSLIATLTSMMTQYKLRIEASSRKFMMLHQFLTQQRVDPQLAMAIKLQVKARSKEKARLKAKDVEYLSLLSNSLQDALWHAWCTQILSKHTFLNSLNLLDAFAMQALCKGAIKAQDVPVSDCIFEEASIGDHMYFVVMGRLRYNPGDLAPESHLSECDDKLLLRPGDWCSEPALWTIWSHLGTLEAISTSEVLSVSGVALQSTLIRFPVAAGVLTDYCVTFHKYINEPGVLKSDLSYVFDINELISGLSSETRMQLATPVIQRLEARFWDQFTSHANMELLKAEVANGKCDIGLVGTEVVRNTFVVALRIYKHDPDTDRFLVKVGEVLRDSGKVVGHCLLPGVKRKWRETYITAVERLLENDLPQISSHVEPHLAEGGNQTVSLQVSQTYGIRTRYLRTTFTATLAPSTRLSYLQAPMDRVQPQPCSSIAWLLRPESRRSEAIQKHSATILSEHDSVVVLHCDEHNRASRKLYLWLNREEFEVLSEHAAKPIIEKWLEALEDEPEPTPEPEIPSPAPSKIAPAVCLPPSKWRELYPS